MPETRARRSHILLAFAALYIVWGSTYLAIRFAIETIPPFLMAGARFVVSGTVLYLFARARGAERPTMQHWRAAAIVGVLLLLGGNGGVVWAEQYVPSGVAALLVATVPLWMVLLDWMRPGGRRPSFGVAAGLALGLAGLALLVGVDDLRSGSGVHLGGALVLTIGAISWSAGSIASKHLVLPKDPLATTGLEMLTGGAALFVLSAAMGEFSGFRPSAVTMRSLLSWGYLVTFGSLIGFTAYIWLLRVVSPAKVSTYAYVNPIVAVFLGWLVASEPLTMRMGIAAAVIVAAVAMITVAQSAASAKSRTFTGEHCVVTLPDETGEARIASDGPSSRGTPRTRARREAAVAEEHG